MKQFLIISALVALILFQGCTSTTPVVVQYVPVPVETVRTVYVRETPRVPAPVAQPQSQPQPEFDRAERDQALQRTMELADCIGREEGEYPCVRRPAGELDYLQDALRRYNESH